MASRRAGVLGHPIGHSLSPALHRAAYAELGLDWDYQAYDVDSGGLPAFLEGVDESWAGLSLTMPLKVEAVPLMDHVEGMAKLVGGVNTVLVQHVGGVRTLVGANTDVWGIQEAFREAGVTRASSEGGRSLSGVILGGGATATSALAALGSLGVTAPVVVVRSRGRAGGLMRTATKMGLAPRFVTFEDAADALAGADAVVSTIPAAAGERVAGTLASVRPGAALLDAIYDPLVTPLGARWADLGGTRIGGERMLAHQAAEQVRLMTGRSVGACTLESVLPAN
ncbi:shikimate dehydrogenase [Demequina pelophila]|uniref:shikimate dehydrogenase n=1 Tax=Demequina pelophila TaxID=1638984 RepID=UPI0007824DC6|nr:shikimate dehydrogenase [Demequina pelophila]